ncbi:MULTISPECIES: alanyl-tRNA editing protein [unclassified Janthinobacterium]|uniref:alanyl-tRNA editing protein n=1 Tax=unclassified Janthinobacterium TaxID=2610881 RepID=UPI00161CA138|nr:MULTISPECIES: alanyl-tRNA editing protein [unclassified Janthinobacterium]MBB5371299.1 Ser-tRNA(Ala) deacylase AlaX [Janthinobacterium sp. K2C7]MBB5384105.1 Ser-tRNA(Ala) deacylase AlaX [Janthinobacterium sp. K2Li3]MBB5389435.1 Ser-tRNA(Ala) deacylase AlaX [Janthinobacterium sp. K2E3]
MTQRIYFNSDQLSMHSQVLSCTPADSGQFNVVLAATLFHPQGGGQPSDMGTINGIIVSRVLQQDELVIHVTEAAIAPGEVEITVLAESRQLHARLHSAGHLLANVIEPLGWRAVKGHHWPGEARVVFERTAAAQELDADKVQAAVNALIQRDMPRNIDMGSDKRMLGFGSLPMTACGGTHVASAGQIKQFVLLKMKEKKGQLSVQYEVAE